MSCIGSILAIGFLLKIKNVEPHPLAPAPPRLRGGEQDFPPLRRRREGGEVYSAKIQSNKGVSKILLPFEFIVTGEPVSLQTNNRILLQTWKAKVRQAALDRLPAGASPTITPVMVIIAYYYKRQPPDLDNIIKPIIDGLNLVVYADDKQVTDLTVKRRNLKLLVNIQTIPSIIAQALANGELFVYVKIDVPPEPVELDK